MPYVADDIEQLLFNNGSRLVGDGYSVTLVREWTKAPPASIWRQGRRVRGNLMIRKGTAIATFQDGFYPNWPHGNHAAIFLYETANGIRVVDQSTLAPPHERTIYFNGDRRDRSNDADAYYIVE
jgi:hypothetical protein